VLSPEGFEYAAWLGVYGGCNRSTGQSFSNQRTSMSDRRLAHRLHCGRSKKILVKIIPDSSGLYRVVWPDIGLSDIANLTRCKQAALEWAEQVMITKRRQIECRSTFEIIEQFLVVSLAHAFKSAGVERLR
jgi:hypothetical protein